MRTIVFSLVLLAGCAGCATLGSGGASYVMPGDDRPMGDVTVQSLEGRSLHLGQWKGRVVLLDLWASWCTPCRDELPALDDLAQRLRGDGVEVVAVSVDVDRAAADELIRSRPRWHLTFGHDPSLAERLNPPTMPSSYVIDGRGRLKQINCGFEPGDIHRVEAQVRGLLNLEPSKGSTPPATDPAGRSPSGSNALLNLEPSKGSSAKSGAHAGR